MKINYVEFTIKADKDHLDFYKNSVNQSFTFTNSKIAYFIKYLIYQV